MNPNAQRNAKKNSLAKSHLPKRQTDRDGMIFRGGLLNCLMLRELEGGEALRCQASRVHP